MESLCDSIVRLAKERGELLLRTRVDKAEMLETSDPAFVDVKSLTTQDLQAVEQC